MAGLGVGAASLASQSDYIGPVSGGCHSGGAGCTGGAGNQAAPNACHAGGTAACTNGGNGTCDSDSSGKCDSYEGGNCTAPCDSDRDGNCEGSCAGGSPCH